MTSGSPLRACVRSASPSRQRRSRVVGARGRSSSPGHARHRAQAASSFVASTRRSRPRHRRGRRARRSTRRRLLVAAHQLERARRIEAGREACRARSLADDSSAGRRAGRRCDRGAGQVRRVHRPTRQPRRGRAVVGRDLERVGQRVAVVEQARRPDSRSSAATTSALIATQRAIARSVERQQIVAGEEVVLGHLAVAAAASRARAACPASRGRTRRRTAARTRR